MPLLPVYPLINGLRKSWASLDVRFGSIALPFLGIKSINYKSSLKSGKVRGTAPQKIGRTRGEHDASSDFEMYKDEADFFIHTLGAGGWGFMEQSFDIVVQYAELTSQIPDTIITDTILGVRIEEMEQSNSEGTDASTVKFTCDAFNVWWNGVSNVMPNKVLV